MRRYGTVRYCNSSSTLRALRDLSKSGNFLYSTSSSLLIGLPTKKEGSAIEGGARGSILKNKFLIDLKIPLYHDCSLVSSM